jgi:bacterioferritin-associated ferredoxin
MYVCVCKAITSSDVEVAISQGASSVAEVTRACRAGGDCGTCHARIDRMIEQRRECSGVIQPVRLHRSRAA